MIQNNARSMPFEPVDQTPGQLVVAAAHVKYPLPLDLVFGELLFEQRRDTDDVAIRGVEALDVSRGGLGVGRADSRQRDVFPGEVRCRCEFLVGWLFLAGQVDRSLR